MAPRKRPSMAEKIDKIVDAGDETVFLTLEELGKESDEYRGLRFHGKKTQLDQDRILQLYRQFVKAFFDRHLLDENSTEDQVDSSCFPSDHAAFCQRARRFLIFMIANGNPRSCEDEHIAYRTASQYRRHLLFWMQRKYMQRDVDAPRPAKVFNELTEAMRGASLLRQLGKPTTPKAYIGLAEIQFMIDVDMRSTPAIELAEQHHLAWCIGRVTALRPSSFGPQPASRRERPGSTGYDDFIMWKDVRITRGSEPGAFHVRLTIRNLKTNRVDPEASAEGPNQVVFNILSPQNKANIPFSVPHRLLIIAIRRNAIAGVDTLEQLLSSQLANVTIKTELLEKPVFLAAGSRGLSLDENKPMPANALTNYLQIRGNAAGFPDKITFYSIRRRMATDLVNSFGNDAAREIMGHSPTSRVLETSYLEFNNIRHTTAVGLGEQIEQQELDRRAALHQQLLRRLDENLVEKSRGQALNALVQEALDGDEDFEKLNDHQEIKNYLKRIRRYCLATLWKQLRAEADRTLTNDLLDQRKEELFKKASDFARRVIDEVRKGKAVLNHEELLSDIARQVEVQGIRFESDFAETGEATQHEDDVEERKIAHGSEISVRVDEGVQDDEEEIDQAVSYLDVVRTFMEILFTNSLSTYTPNEKLKCPLCAADPTISAEKKTQERSIFHHNNHLNAKLHSAFEQYRRTTELAMKQKREREPDKQHRYECSFCAQVYSEDCGEDLQTFLHFYQLVKHIKESDGELIHGTGAWKLDEAKTERHDCLKREAGWYDTDFEGNEEARAQQRATEQKNKAKAAGVEWSSEPALSSGTPDENFPDLVKGGPAFSADETLAVSGEAFVAGDLVAGLAADETVSMSGGLLFAGDHDEGPSTIQTITSSQGLLTDKPPVKKKLRSD